ncbi:MAG: SIMPL domain-containing protein [Halobacterium sp.]
MRQKTVLIAVLASALLVTAGVAGALALSSGSASAGEAAPSEQSITVSADGEVEAQADQAVLRVAVTATGENSTAVRDRIASQSDSMRSALEEYGLDSEAIRTAHYDIRQERKERPDGTDSGQYRGVHAFEITVNDTERAGEVLDVAVNNGADRVMGVSFTLSDEKREALYQDALTEAMANAETRASTLAEAGGLSVTETHSVVSTNTRYHAYEAEAVAYASGSAGTSIESGPVTVTANVRVVYNATTA